MDGIALLSHPVDQNATACVLEVSGYIDTSTCSHLEAELNRLIETGQRQIYLDLSTVDYISSAGWGTLISTIRQLRSRDGDLRLVGMQPDVQDVFELLEFHSILEAFPTLEEALALSPAG